MYRDGLPYLTMRASTLTILLALIAPVVLMAGLSPHAAAGRSQVACSPEVFNLESNGPSVACSLVLPGTPDPATIDPRAVNLVVFHSGLLLAKIPATAPCDPCVSGRDPNGGVRAKFSFDRDEVSHWIRVAMPLAGKDRGANCLPETQDEVLVAFEMGDARFPFLFQRVWDGCDFAAGNR